MSTTLDRTLFTTSRAMEFFTARELQMQIGAAPDDWATALLKELIDNALDAGETTSTAPQIRVMVEEDLLTVHDNGPGLPVAALERSLDYQVRVSDKAYYVSPTRGQLGNALKCVWAAPFVLSGQYGRVDVTTHGETHRIEVTLDRVKQEPRLRRTVEPAPDVKTGTVFRLHWPGVARYLGFDDEGKSYNRDAWDLIRGFASLNPHAGFSLETQAEKYTWEPTLPDWRKWRTDAPTSPHWYSPEALASLIAAYLSTGTTRTVRELVAEFNGLTGTAKQKAVTDAAGLTGATLQSLVRGEGLDAATIRCLLYAMKEAARPIKPAALGALGEGHLRAVLAADFCAAEDSIRYRKVEGEADGLPFIIEAAFGVNVPEYAEYGIDLQTGLNWTPALRIPTQHLFHVLAGNRVDSFDPVSLVLHLCCPRFTFTDRGKGALALPTEMKDALERCVEDVTRKWKDAKRQADRDNRVKERALHELRRANKPETLSTKAAAYRVMEEAYLKASDGGRLPANARQIMYAARPLIQRLTGKERPWSTDSYFTQHLLPDFLEEHPELTAAWDVVYDARGRLVEPHTGRRADLGTLDVRRYLRDWRDHIPGGVSIELDPSCPTCGPAHRYRYALFIEKEGFYELFNAARIADRFDLAILSSKGMSVTAARLLVENLSQAGVTVFVLRDFDKSGFSIAHSLQSDNRRYTFRERPNVVDLGLRLADVEALGLESEDVEYDGEKDPRENLRESGATEAECNFLVGQQVRGKWSGRRVELNAMTSGQFVEWLEGKLRGAGVGKVVPDGKTLAAAYRRARRYAEIQAAIDKATEALRDEEIPVPDGLAEQVAAALEGTGDAWDTALWRLAQAEPG